MKMENVEQALTKAISYESSLDKCNFSLAICTFLDELSDSANWWQKFGVLAVRSAIEKWRRVQCPHD